MPDRPTCRLPVVGAMSFVGGASRKRKAEIEPKRLEAISNKPAERYALRRTLRESQKKLLRKAAKLTSGTHGSSSNTAALSEPPVLPSPSFALPPALAEPATDPRQEIIQLFLDSALPAAVA